MSKDELEANLGDENDPIYSKLLDENGDPLVVFLGSESELDHDSESSDDSEPETDKVLIQAAHQIEAKKRSERCTSFDYGFEIPATIRKELVAKKKNAKTNKKRKENQSNDHINKQKKPLIKRSKNTKLMQRFSRITKRLPLRSRNKCDVSTKKSKQEKKSIQSKTKKDYSGGTGIVLGKRKIADKTEKSQQPKRTCSQSLVITHQNFAPQNKSGTLTETDFNLEWNTRQNSITDLMLQYFDVISQADKIIKMKCKLCGERKQPISVVLGNNSNLKNHMKAVSSF